MGHETRHKVNIDFKTSRTLTSQNGLPGYLPNPGFTFMVSKHAVGERIERLFF